QTLSTNEASRAAIAAASTVRRDTVPATSGLSVRPPAVSRSASRASLDHPMDNWPASTATANTATEPGPGLCHAPAPTVSATVIAVIARHGPGWLDCARARTGAWVIVTIVSLRSKANVCELVIIHVRLPWIGAELRARRSAP